MPIEVIMPAAGKSKRMGKNKYLLTLGKKTIIEHCIANLVNADIGNIYVVLNDENQDIQDYIKKYNINIVINNLKDSYMADSIRLALNRISTDNALECGILITPADMPLIQSKTIKEIIDLSHKNPSSIVIPTYNGKRGHPTIFPYNIIKELNYAETLLDVIDIHKNSLLLYPVNDTGVTLDIDTVDDYEYAKEIYRTFNKI
jgi:molybdenum cofactor cytidylyltransferase